MFLDYCKFSKWAVSGSNKFMKNLNITKYMIRCKSQRRSHHFSGFTNSIDVATSHVNLWLGIFVHHRRSCVKHSRVLILQNISHKLGITRNTNKSPYTISGSNALQNSKYGLCLEEPWRRGAAWKSHCQMMWRTIEKGEAHNRKLKNKNCRSIWKLRTTTTTHKKFLNSIISKLERMD